MLRPGLLTIAAVFVAAFLLIIVLRKRERHGGVEEMGSARSSHLSTRASPPAPATVENGSPRASSLPPPRLSPVMPVKYLGDHNQIRVFKGRRPVVDDETILEELGHIAPHFGGPWPKSLSDVPMTNELRRRIDYREPDQPMPGDEYVNERLGFRARLRACLEAAGVKGPGTVILQLVYEVDQTTHLGRSSNVIMETSSLPEREDPSFYDCVVSSHVGRTMRFRESFGTPGLFIADTLSVPVTDDSYYRNLFDVKPPS
jgi:hypothetical protein